MMQHNVCMGYFILVVLVCQTVLNTDFSSSVCILSDSTPDCMGQIANKEYIYL